MQAGPAPSWLWLCGVAYCKEGLTDGFIPDEAIDYLGVKNARRMIPHLEQSGLWIRVENGWMVNDFLSHNASASTVRGLSDARSKAGASGGRRSGEERRKKEKPVVIDRRADPDEASCFDENEANPKQTSNPDREIEREIERSPQPPKGAVSAKTRDAVPEAGATALTVPGPRPVAAPSPRRADPPPGVLADDVVAARAGEFLQRIPAIYAKSRNGARYVVKHARDHPTAMDLVTAWPDLEYLSDMYELFLRKDEWKPKNVPGSPGQFRHMAPQCDAILRQHGHRGSKAAS